MLTSTQKSVIEFSLNGKLAGKIASTALQAVRAERMTAKAEDEIPTIDDFNDFMADLEAASESTRFMSDAGLEKEVLTAEDKLRTWIGFAETNSLSPNVQNVLKYMLTNMQNDLYSPEEIEQISKRTRVDAKVVRATNIKEVQAKMAQFKEDAISALQLINIIEPNYEVAHMKEDIANLLHSACGSSRKAIGKRMGSFTDKVVDLDLIDEIEQNMDYILV